MIDAITTLTSGLQQSIARVNTAAQAVTNPQNFGATPPVSSANASDFASPTNAALAGGTLEAAIVGLKFAANSYKANAEALSIILETQKEAFEKLV